MGGEAGEFRTPQTDVASATEFTSVGRGTNPMSPATANEVRKSRPRPVLANEPVDIKHCPSTNIPTLVSDFTMGHIPNAGSAIGGTRKDEICSNSPMPPSSSGIDSDILSFSPPRPLRSQRFSKVGYDSLCLPETGHIYRSPLSPVYALVSTISDPSPRSLVSKRL